MHGRILQVSSNPNEHPFERLCDCENRLHLLPIGEEFRRAFIWYACATILAPTSRVDGCQNLWPTLHRDDLGMMSIWLNFLWMNLFLESDIFNSHKSNANQNHKKLGYLVVLFFYRLAFY